MISLFIDNTDVQRDIANGSKYHSFLNECAKIGGCHHLLKFIPQYSVGVWGKLDKPSEGNKLISLDILKTEIDYLLSKELSARARYIAEIYKEVILEAEKLQENITIE